ncbi:MAG: hypothetical protein OQL19_08975 [Gammaproteobacteria bacterium]|nr:hypothetical protein [Gammaproteobacteria bacterium]
MTLGDESEFTSELTSEEPHKIDFKDTIERLELRAKRSRRRVFVLGVMLFLSVILITTLLVSITSSPSSFVLRSFDGDSRTSIESPFVRRVKGLMEDLIGSENILGTRGKHVKPDEDAAKKIKIELEESLVILERVLKIADYGKTEKSQEFVWAPILSTGIFSLGAVAFVILFIQISVTFIRFHTRLAELYEAQADALRASDGDSERAYKFMEQFSPNAIDLGKIPTTIYEKALDTIKDVAKK